MFQAPKLTKHRRKCLQISVPPTRMSSTASGVRPWADQQCVSCGRERSATSGGGRPKPRVAALARPRCPWSCGMLLLKSGCSSALRGRLDSCISPESVPPGGGHRCHEENPGDMYGWVSSCAHSNDEMQYIYSWPVNLHSLLAGRSCSLNWFWRWELGMLWTSVVHP